MNKTTPQKIVLIGASTGGPGEIQKLISALPILNHTAIIIAQHISLEFIPSFVERLQSLSKNRVCMAHDAQRLDSACVYVCYGNASVDFYNERYVFKVEPSKANRYNPDINAIFGSFANYANTSEILGVILTGIGDDGVEGCKKLSLGGAKVLTQDSKTAIVDGMPSRAREEINAIEVGDREFIIMKVVEFCK